MAAASNGFIIRLPSSGGLAVELVAGGGDAVEIKLPHQKVLAAGFDDGVFHAQLAREPRDGLPAHVGMFDIGFLVELEEIELLIVELEELAPALAFQAEPALLPHQAIAVTRNVGAFG